MLTVFVFIFHQYNWTGKTRQCRNQQLQAIKHTKIQEQEYHPLESSTRRNLASGDQ